MRAIGIVLVVLGLVGLIYGGLTWTRRERVADILVDNAIAVIEGRRPPNIYNPEIYEKR